MKINIVPYSHKYYKLWNDFIPKTYNATFLHHRDYMDYHSDRFQDHSLLLFNENKLLALLPANSKDDRLYSHSGLTYGDLLIDKNIKTKIRLELLESLINYLKLKKMKAWEIRSIPSIFHNLTDEGMNYLYHQKGAKIKKNLAFYYVNKDNYKLNNNRYRNIKKAFNDFDLKISFDSKYLNDYWALVINNLKLNHNTTPVHSITEISRLLNNFPENIKLVSIFDKNRLLGGVLLFIVNEALHFQYINSEIEKKVRNSIDYLVNEIIKKNIDKYKFISLGSAENRDGTINADLVYWKESFGARAVNQYFFEFKF